MNKVYCFLAVFASFASGCTSTSVNKPVTSSNSNSICADTCPLVSKGDSQKTYTNTENLSDNQTIASTSGQVIGKGARMVWDAGRNAWVYVSSDDTKDKVVSAWQVTKKVAFDVKNGLADGFKNQGEK